jgi:hypothetical protein
VPHVGLGLFVEEGDDNDRSNCDRDAPTGCGSTRPCDRPRRWSSVGVLDPSVPPGAEFPVVLAEGPGPTVGGTDAHGGQTVNYSCGNNVDAYTVCGDDR